MFKYFWIIFFSSSAFSQKDNVQAVYDSLDKVYFFNDVKVSSKNNKYNFKSGEIPVYDNKTYENRIDLLAEKSPFNYRYNRVVQNYITMYSKRIKSTGTILALSELYFPLYEKYLSQYGLPLELKYLSIVESALNPTAVSPCGASGLWQFMYGTGKAYKLEINSFIDERFDPEKETIAACLYLKDLYSVYKQWDLAIAAYNCGPGNVNKAIKRAGGKADFWAIYDFLPKETQGYVPAFIAASYIVEYHEEHNILAADANIIYDELDFIEVNYRLSLKQIAFLLNMNHKQLKYLNPKYIAGIVPGNNSLVVVPKQKALDWIDIESALDAGKVPVIKKDQVKTASSNTSTPVKSTTLTLQSTLTIPVQTEFTKKSPFGTYYLNANKDKEKKLTTTLKDEIILKKEKKDSLFVSRVEETVSFLCFSNGNQILTDGAPITLRTAQEITIQSYLIPKNSILSGRVQFKSNSVFITILSSKMASGEVPVQLFTELQEKPGKDRRVFLEDGYAFLLKG